MAQVSFKRGTTVPSVREEGALYLKENSANEKFDLYFGGSNKILKLNAETASKAVCLQSPGSSTSLGYLDWTGSQENCDWFATWDDQTYSGKPTVRAMDAFHMRENLSVYSKAESDSRYVNIGGDTMTGSLSCPIIATTNHGTGVPGSSTPGSGTAGALYFRIIS